MSNASVSDNEIKHVYHPSKGNIRRWPWCGLTFDPVAMQEMINKGQAAADDFIAVIPPTDITWV